MKRAINFAAGLVVGAALFGGGTALAASGILAELSTQPIYLDGQQVQMEAYAIGGSNYVKLRDVGKAVGFNVYWDGGVQIDSDAPYTGVAPETTPSQTEAAGDSVDVETAKDEIIRLTNDLRRENGVAELRTDDLLMQAAQVRAEELAAQAEVTHTRPDGSPYYTVTDVPYTNENHTQIFDLYLQQQKRALGEAAVNISWANSENHKRNLLNEQTNSIGVGIARGLDDDGDVCYYCTQLFLYGGYTITRVNPITTE